MKKIVLTGGGTAGHVTPNIALLPALREAGFEVLYIGSYEGMERKLIEATGTPYRGISSGKLRRYFDWKNFTDPFRVLKGYGEAKAILREFRPDHRDSQTVSPTVRRPKSAVTSPRHFPCSRKTRPCSPALRYARSSSRAAARRPMNEPALRQRARCSS